jgi:hypothetical protein
LDLKSKISIVSNAKCYGFDLIDDKLKCSIHGTVIDLLKADRATNIAENV